ncbi:MAG: hypothetical protein ACXVCP_01840 [Bdellovibrio sp.]
MKKAILLTSMICSVHLNALAQAENIDANYKLGNGRVFFVDPNDRGTNTQVVDFFDAQCNHVEVKADKGASTTHLITLTLTPCIRTEVRGVVTNPVPDDMVVDEFNSIVNFNIAKTGRDQITTGNLYQVLKSDTLLIGEQKVNLQSLAGSESDLKEITQIQTNLNNLKQKCEEIKKQTLTKYLGDAGKVEKIIAASSVNFYGPYLEENAKKCSATPFAGKVFLK